MAHQPLFDHRKWPSQSGRRFVEKTRFLVQGGPPDPVITGLKSLL